jgi:PAS domain-containing protein
MDLHVLKLPKLIAERRSSAIFGVLIIAMLWLDLQLHALAALALTLVILMAMERILRTEAKARHKVEQLALTLENMSQGIMLVTKDRQIPIINSRCGELLGLPAELIQRPPRFDRLVEFQASLPSDCCRPAPRRRMQAG